MQQMYKTLHTMIIDLKKTLYTQKLYIFATMQNLKIIILFVFAGYISLLNSCKTDFEINAPYSDIPIVYGLINPSDSLQYIKITKAFLGNGDATQIAQVADSSYYSSELEVKVVDNTAYKEYLLNDTVVYTKHAGDFYYPSQRLFYFKAKPATPSALRLGDEYKLIIKNKGSGKIITSTTKMVENFYVEKPPADNPNYPPVKIPFASPNSNEVKFTTAKHGMLYDVVIRFYYTESIGGGSFVEKSVDWNIGSVKADNVNGGESKSLLFFGDGFYRNVTAQVLPQSGIVRRVGRLSNTQHHIDFVFSVAGDELATYLDVNQPSGSIVQEKPEYSNIQGGIGVFASRYTKTIKKMMNDDSRKKLNGFGLGFNEQ